ncbi:unnamed protein product [Chilo suppressalis]|uniref:BTB domain-containing protein n=1 Tax=Chilo suppressalis TaxID=168631 RepID=A0ABN8AS34_CHISP|nr:unnamed protein product [Chilo suppressalis]
MDDDQQFCLRWNNHQSTLVSVFDTLLEKGIHVDCTLAAEGQTLKAHKVVLSACSPYFESVLSQQFDKHPIIILKDVKYAELRAMMDYMYRGEVNISQDQLAALLKAAESLQIKGLSDNKPSRPPSRPAAPVAPPRPASPAHPPQVRDGSVDSREGSTSPSRRRKRARRSSLSPAGNGDSPPAPALPTGPASAPAPAPPAALKDEPSRDNVEDLTLDDEPADHAPHNDVVRNFQWHMERSQDEIMNSNDSARDSQGPKRSLRNKISTLTQEVIDEPPSKTYAILKNMKPKDPAQEEAKENAKQQTETKKSPESDDKSDSKYNIFPNDKTGFALTKNKTEKGYKCPNCSRCYNARRNLVRHVTLECGREPQYKCPYCSCSKHRRNELKNHINKKHPNQPKK